MRTSVRTTQETKVTSTPQRSEEVISSPSVSNISSASSIRSRVSGVLEPNQAIDESQSNPSRRQSVTSSSITSDVLNFENSEGESRFQLTLILE